jgi:hypothetical protein
MEGDEEEGGTPSEPREYRLSFERERDEKLTDLDGGLDLVTREDLK